jgi:hypothetical protein
MRDKENRETYKEKIQERKKIKLVVYVDVLLQNTLKEDTNKLLSILSL